MLDVFSFVYMFSLFLSLSLYLSLPPSDLLYSLSRVSFRRLIHVRDEGTILRIPNFKYLIMTFSPEAICLRTEPSIQRDALYDH